MKKTYLIALCAIVSAGMVSCTSLSSSTASTLTSVAKASLSQAEITAGLKEALTVGVTKGVQTLGKSNGFYNDLAVRIGLPEEALVITENISKLPGGQTLVNNVIKNINAAASDAASEAAPIFINAITDMTITDAAKILAGNNTAATSYFKTKTKTSLKKLFASKIQTSLDKKILGDVSASSSWNTLTSKWNTVAGSIVGKAAGLNTVNTDLTDYLTEKAVDGLYQKVGEQEKEIRTKASARTTATLKRVFGR